MNRSDRQARGQAMKTFFLKFFTWWNSQTFGTQLTIWRVGVFVGEDEFGNRYYRSRFAKDPALGHERRWVVYHGQAEASAIPPGWWGWMHHRTAEPPTASAYQPRAWQQPHQPNATGTAAAYRPPGSTLNAGRRPKATGDYQAWTPGS
jgi:NADH:ubiquinone oxidoreductase subunit